MGLKFAHQNIMDQTFKIQQLQRPKATPFAFRQF